MVFPQQQIDEMKKQTDRDLTRFDLDFDLPEHLLPEFPAPIFLTTRPDLGDVSKGKLVTLANFHELFKDILNPKQLEGLRLLLTPFPQPQFNATDDRRALTAHQGVACLDCHSNGHTNAATHTVGDIRPNEHRHRIDTPTLRGVNVQRLFGSQRALKTVEDFTEFEQRAAYFDGDPVQAREEGREHPRARQPGALHGRVPGHPRLPARAEARRVRQARSARRRARASCAASRCSSARASAASATRRPTTPTTRCTTCSVERFFAEKMINGRKASADGPIKTFPLRGIKDSPPYLHDDRLLTLEDTVEFFNLVLGVKLTDEEKGDLVAFLRVQRLG